VKLNLEVPDAHCSYCDRLLDRALASDGVSRPAPGDISICMYCTKVNIWTDDLQLRKPTEQERVEMLKNPKLRAEIRRGQRAIRNLKKDEN